MQLRALIRVTLSIRLFIYDALGTAGCRVTLQEIRIDARGGVE